MEIVGGADDDEDNCWLTAITVDERVAGVSAREVSAALTEAGIESRPVWKPLHLQPVFADCGGVIDGSAERIFEQGITLPSGSGMSRQEFAEVESRLSEALQSGLVDAMRHPKPAVPRQHVVHKEQGQGLRT